MKDKSTVHKELNLDLFETGNKIREIKESKGLSQDDFAAIMGLSKASVYQYENAVVHMTIDILYLIADKFGVTPNELAPERFCNKSERDEQIDEMVDAMQKLNDTQLKIVYDTTIAIINSMINNA